MPSKLVFFAFDVYNETGLTASAARYVDLHCVGRRGARFKKE